MEGVFHPAVTSGQQPSSAKQQLDQTEWSQGASTSVSMEWMEKLRWTAL